MTKFSVGFIAQAIREGYLDRRNCVPGYVDRDGWPVYRTLLHGLYWRKLRPGSYESQDGSRRWTVIREGGEWTASVTFAGQGPREVRGCLGRFETMRLARQACAERARRMPWVEGAPW